jgi:NRPS condensation-like uncharacterized protein
VYISQLINIKTFNWLNRIMTKLRNLSLIEKDYYDANLPILIPVEIDELLDAKKIESAIEKLQVMHPFLRCSIEVEEGNPYLAEKSENKVPVVVNETEDITTAKDKFIEQHLNQVIDYSSILFKLSILQDKNTSLILFIIHHAICDAVSGIELVKSFFEFYRDPSLAVRKLNAHPPIDEFIPNFSLVDKAAFIERYRQNLEKYKPVNIEPNKSSDENLVVKRYNFTINAEAIMSYAKSNQVSVHGLLGSLFARSLKDIAAKDKTSVGILMQSAIDLRKRANPPIDSKHLISAPIGPQSTFITLNENDDISAAASDITNYIKMDIARNGHFDEMLASVYSNFDYKQNKIGFFLSNSGVCPELDDVIKDISFLSPVYYESFFITVVTHNNQMSFNIVYRTPWFTEEIVERLLAGFKARVLKLNKY